MNLSWINRELIVNLHSRTDSVVYGEEKRAKRVKNLYFYSVQLSVAESRVPNECLPSTATYNDTIIAKIIPSATFTAFADTFMKVDSHPRLAFQTIGTNSIVNHQMMEHGINVQFRHAVSVGVKIGLANYQHVVLSYEIVKGIFHGVVEGCVLVFETKFLCPICFHVGRDFCEYCFLTAFMPQVPPCCGKTTRQVWING